MRTLLVDNYDSFTYNLYHQIAEVDGAVPVVVRNDEPSWRPERLAEFDNVIISPGPGAPGRPADFGICRDIIEHCDRPILGVCLGHQGIALVHGGVVGPAPEVRHGRLSRVEHQQTGLFAGIPSGFRAVRYHSLAASELPEELEAIAWTPEGVLMGLRHRTRPQWGVQFHPESISTEHGHRLLANFADLTRRHRAENVARPYEIRPAPALVAPTDHVRDGPAAPVRKTRVEALRLVTRWTDEVVFDRLVRGRDHAFWLDSSRVDGALGRFSVMGDATGPLARIASADVAAGTVTVTYVAGSSETVSASFFDWLDRDLRSTACETPDLPFEFALGWVGYLGYELKAQCGGAAAHRSRLPDAVMVFADRAIVLDHAEGFTYLLALVEDDDHESGRVWFGELAERLAGLVGAAVDDANPVVTSAPAPGLHLRLRHPRDRYLDLIRDCQRAITAGETYEVCLTNMATAEAVVDPARAYHVLRRLSPAPFGALLSFGPQSILSTSPERFLRVDRDGVIESKPIKGTRPRGRTPEADEALRNALAADEKDRAENLMIVDLVRNDLGRCAQVGSVHVPKLFDVETYATVHQLVSTVRARLREDCSAVDCVRAAFPGGSMTGAPKVRTMGIIDSLEAGPRGVYSGAIGYFSLTGAVDLSIVIRTLVVEPDRVTYGIGGAIIALSDPDEEYEETAVKATPLLRLLAADFPDREPEAGRR